MYDEYELWIVMWIYEYVDFYMIGYVWFINTALCFVFQ